MESGVSAESVALELMATEEAQLYRTKLFAPPGHFYSPIVDTKEAAAYFDVSVDRAHSTERLAGVNIDNEAMLSLWAELAGLMNTSAMPYEEAEGWRYRVNNDAFAYGDGYVLNAMLRKFRPRRLIEVGSGWSSACALDTIEKHGVGCECPFIEPFPRLLHSIIGPTRDGTNVVEAKVQEVPLSVFGALESGDFQFIDSTHVMRTGSDVCYELLEILPLLKPGVLVHIHDMFWPFEYPRQWVVEQNRSWNEIYAVRAFLSSNSEWSMLFFNEYMGKRNREAVLRQFPDFLVHPGGGLWLQKSAL